MATIKFTNFRGEDSSSTKLRRMGDYTGPGLANGGVGYQANVGDVLLPADVKLGTLNLVLFELAKSVSANKIYLLHWSDSANAGVNGQSCVTWWDPTTGAQVPNGTDLSGYTAKFEAIGQ